MASPALIAPAAVAQLSLTSAVEIALGSSPRVKSALADVARADAQLSQSKDAYIPSINAGAGLGEAYGYTSSPPTLFNVTAGSLAFNSQQIYFIRSARAAVNAAKLALEDVQEDVAQEAALDYIALDHDQQREAVMRQQTAYANRLVAIVQDRVNAGQDSQIDLTQAKISAAQYRLNALHAEDDVEFDRERLGRLIDLPAASLRIDSAFPSAAVPDTSPDRPVNGYANAGIASAFANAEARQKQAEGETKFLYWPQFNFFAQYNRYATFTDTFATLKGSSGNDIGANEYAAGVQIVIPLFDKGRSARARETAADAAKALHDAENSQIQALDGLSRSRRSIAEIQARAEVASLQQQLAQQQLDVLRLQLQSGNPGGAPMTPKDEQNALIAERDKYLGVVDAGFDLHQAEIQLMRQNGELIDWLKAAAHTP